MIDERGIAERILRLQTLALGLSKEVLLIRQAQDPMLYLERRAYLVAVQNGLASLDSARVVLAQVRQRMADLRRMRQADGAAKQPIRDGTGLDCDCLLSEEGPKDQEKM